MKSDHQLFEPSRIARVGFVTESEELYLRSPLKLTSDSSFCGSIALASYICDHLPGIYPPNFIESLKEDQRYTSLALQPWSDYLSSLHWQHSRGWVCKRKDLIIYTCRVETKYLDTIKAKFADQFDISQHHSSEKQTGHKYPYEQAKLKKIGIINFVTFQLSSDPFIPHSSMVSLYEGIWFRQGDSWKVYNILRGQIPTQEQLGMLDILLLSGSGSSVNDQNQYAQKCLYQINTALRTNHNLRVIGFCFGHQGIAKSMGGRVQQKHFVHGLQQVVFDEKIIQRYNFLAPLASRRVFLLNQYHSDHVVAKPRDFDIIGKSDSCGNQAMISKDGRCLCFQFHPEYSYRSQKKLDELMEKYSEGSVKYPRGCSYNKSICIEQDELEHQDSLRIFRMVIRNYMDANTVDLLPKC